MSAKENVKEDAFKGLKRMPKPGEFPAETQKNKEGIGLQQDMQAKPMTLETADEAHMVDNVPSLSSYRPSGRLAGRKALITGGDSGIGRAVAVFFAKEGASVAISYHPIEQKDAEDTRDLIHKESGCCTTKEEKKGEKEEQQRCVLLPMDLDSEASCKKLIDQAIGSLGSIDLLVSNAAYQMTCDNIEELSAAQIEKTFTVNIFSPMYLVKHAVSKMRRGSSIIFSTSVLAYKGNKRLVDYACTKSALVSLVRSLAAQLAPRGIRVNGVAPGPVWTPLQPISRTKEDMKRFGEKKLLLGRVAQPSEIAPSYVFLASSDGSQYTGQVLHPNGGDIVGS